LKHGKKLELPFTKSRVPSQNEAENPATKRFASVEVYLRTMHPEYDFVFDLKQHARERWHYSEKQAEVTQAHMIENAFEVALRTDREKGLEIIIDE
jgi:hypothetical protein